MKTVAQLLEENVTHQPLSILVFGPAVSPPSADSRLRDLQKKRVELRTKLEDAKHDVQYGEDVIDPTLPPPCNNPVLQEMLVMQDCDLVINLIYSPGTNVELGIIASKKGICSKACLFLAADHRGGLADQACQLAEQLGAHFSEYTYPTDIVDCHLVTRIMERVRVIQLAKFLA